MLSQRSLLIQDMLRRAREQMDFASVLEPIVEPAQEPRDGSAILAADVIRVARLAAAMHLAHFTTGMPDIDSTHADITAEIAEVLP